MIAKRIKYANAFRSVRKNMTGRDLRKLVTDKIKKRKLFKWIISETHERTVISPVPDSFEDESITRGGMRFSSGLVSQSPGVQAEFERKNKRKGKWNSKNSAERNKKNQSSKRSGN